MEPLVNEESGKTAGIISYFSIIGWLIAYFGMHQNNKTSIGSYQLRQTLLLHIVSFAVGIIFNIILIPIIIATGFFAFSYLVNLLWLGFLVLWIIGLIGAINGEKKPIPLIGDRAQTMFPGI
ncbi:MAG TPA: DUF4870 domain-containing protein [Mucilaginibacter sp.]|jgi:uncharacterized membrane protein|nr:DUF4870 domain-containing protein [Mucilaginibacter sp.]